MVSNHEISILNVCATVGKEGSTKRLHGSSTFIVMNQWCVCKCSRKCYWQPACYQQQQHHHIHSICEKLRGVFTACPNKQFSRPSSKNGQNWRVNGSLLLLCSVFLVWRPSLLRSLSLSLVEWVFLAPCPPLGHMVFYLNYKGVLLLLKGHQVETILFEALDGRRPHALGRNNCHHIAE